MSQTHSPLPNQAQKGATNFYKALEQVVTGKKITKLEWKNKEFYGVIDKEILKLHKPDGKLYDWIISTGDLSGDDWVIL